MKRTVLTISACLLPLLCSAQVFTADQLVTPITIDRLVDAPAPPGEENTVCMRVTASKVTFCKCSRKFRKVYGAGITTVPTEELEALLAILTKYEEWQKIATEKNVHYFARSIGKLNGQDVLVRWRQDLQTLELFLPKPENMQEPFRESFIYAIRELAKQYPEAKAEVDRLNALKDKEQELFK